MIFLNYLFLVLCIFNIMEKVNFFFGDNMVVNVLMLVEKMEIEAYL